MSRTLKRCVYGGHRKGRGITPGYHGHLGGELADSPPVAVGGKHIRKGSLLFREVNSKGYKEGEDREQGQGGAWALVKGARGSQ